MEGPAEEGTGGSGPAAAPETQSATEAGGFIRVAKRSKRKRRAAELDGGGGGGSRMDTGQPWPSKRPDFPPVCGDALRVSRDVPGLGSGGAVAGTGPARGA